MPVPKWKLAKEVRGHAPPGIFFYLFCIFKVFKDVLFESFEKSFKSGGHVPPVLSSAPAFMLLEMSQ